MTAGKGVLFLDDPQKGGVSRSCQEAHAPPRSETPPDIGQKRFHSLVWIQQLDLTPSNDVQPVGWIMLTIQRRPRWKLLAEKHVAQFCDLEFGESAEDVNAAHVLKDASIA